MHSLVFETFQCLISTAAALCVPYSTAHPYHSVNSVVSCPLLPRHRILAHLSNISGRLCGISPNTVRRRIHSTSVNGFGYQYTRIGNKAEWSCLCCFSHITIHDATNTRVGYIMVVRTKLSNGYGPWSLSCTSGGLRT